MATTSRGIVTPNQTDEYKLVTDLNTMATSIDEALKDAANTYRGTSTQRTQFTSQAPEGTIWVDTNGEKIVWVKQGVSWRRIWGYGVNPLGQVQGGSEQSIPNASFTTITFPGATPDLQGGVTWAGGAFTVPSEGIYSMTANYRFKGPTGGNRGMYIQINGINSAGNYSPNGIVGHTLSASLVRQLSAGDAISLGVYQASGSASTTDALWGLPNLSVSRIG